MARSLEQRKADWAKYYATHSEKLKALSAAKKKALSPEELAIKAKERSEINKKYYEANRARIANRLEERREERLAVQAEYRKNNPEKNKARRVKYYTENRKLLAEKAEVYRKDNPDKRAAFEGKRRSRKLNATPKWANDFFISEAYHLAKIREQVVGGKWHVDHIVPLQSKLVCGLHNEFNVQVIPGKENLSKGNRFWPDMPA